MATLPILTETEILARFECATCKTVGIEDYPDASDYSDANGASLIDARLTPTGAWVCSQPCLSQAMFESATVREEESLRRYELALSDMQEVLPFIDGLFEKWGVDAAIAVRPIDNAQRELGIAKKDSAPWIKANVPPADILRAAIGKVLGILEYRVMPTAQQELSFQRKILAEMPAIELRSTSGLAAYNLGRVLGSVARIITILKAALNGEVAE